MKVYIVTNSYGVDYSDSSDMYDILGVYSSVDLAIERANKFLDETLGKKLEDEVRFIFTKSNWNSVCNYKCPDCDYDYSFLTIDEYEMDWFPSKEM